MLNSSREDDEVLEKRKLQVCKTFRKAKNFPNGNTGSNRPWS